MSLHDVPIHIPNSNHFIWQTQIHCHCNSWLVSINWKYSSPVNEKDKYVHKYGPIPIKFSAILWPCLILELLGPLSLFNCVYISAWAIHNVNIFQCIGRANTYPILLLTESIFAWTIWVRGQADITGGDFSLDSDNVGSDVLEKAMSHLEQGGLLLRTPIWSEESSSGRTPPTALHAAKFTSTRSSLTTRPWTELVRGNGLRKKTKKPWTDGIPGGCELSTLLWNTQERESHLNYTTST